MKKSYEELLKIFADKGCELYITKEKYDTINNLCHCKFSFKTSCGHVPDSDIFYILPESELYKNGFIKDANKEECHPNKMFLNLSLNSESSWYHKYKYDYKKIDKDIISNFF